MDRLDHQNRVNFCDPIKDIDDYIKTHFYDVCKNAKTEADAKTTLCWGLLLSGQNDKFGTLKCKGLITEPDCGMIPEDDAHFCTDLIDYNQYFPALKYVCNYYSVRINLSSYRKLYDNTHCDYLRADLCDPIKYGVKFITINYYNYCMKAKNDTNAYKKLCWGLLLSGKDKYFKNSGCFDFIGEPNCTLLKGSPQKMCNTLKSQGHYSNAYGYLCNSIDNITYDKINCEYLNYLHQV